MKVRIEKRSLDRFLRKIDPRRRDVYLRKGLWKSAQYLAGWTKLKRLTGPRPKYLGVVTGMLRSSIKASAATKTGNIYRVGIGTNVVYAHRHEYGTFGMPARPFMRPAIKNRKNIEGVESDLIKVINKALAVA